jgi:L,D-transpeptidase catalytic domain/Bacterial SH3 domain
LGVPQRSDRRLPTHRIRLLTCTLIALIALLVFPYATHANRLGPPWQSRVSVDSTTLFSQPDRSSPAVGSLTRGQLVVVIGESTAGDGTEWTQVPDGYVLSSDLTEEFQPWVAEVSVNSVAVHNRPNARDPVRRTARRGDLLRVTGVSPGIDGDTGLWWATTEGFVGLPTLQTATSEWAAEWALPSAGDAPNGWWGTIRSQANVRAGTSTQAPVVGTLVAGDRVKVLGEEEGSPVSGNRIWLVIDGGRYAGAKVHSSLVNRMPEPRAVSAPRSENAPPGGWIAVSRSAATLSYLDDSGQPRFTTYVSLGRAGVETPQGGYETLGKYRADTMSSTTVTDADRAYHLPNVPFVEYYRDGGYAIHGTYWHDQFGRVASQGCINLTWADSAYLFDLTQPEVPPDLLARWAINVPATPVVIVD